MGSPTAVTSWGAVEGTDVQQITGMVSRGLWVILYVVLTTSSAILVFVFLESI